MKTLWKIVAILLCFWLVVLLYLGGAIGPNAEIHVSTKDLNKMVSEIELMKEQNEMLRKQAKELREIALIQNDPQLSKDETVKYLQQQLDKAQKQIADLSQTIQSGKKLSSGTSGNSLNDNGPTREQEKLRRRIENGVTEFWYYLKSKVSKFKDVDAKEISLKIHEVLEDGGHQQRSILTDLHHLSNSAGLGEWRQNEAKALSDVIQKRLKYLQNPKDCSKAKKLVCNLNKGCGYGCQLHHVIYCMIIAYGSERTLILESKGWRYSRDGWEKFFLPLSETCRDSAGSSSRSSWGEYDRIKDVQVVDLPIVDGLHPRPSYLPLSIPEDLAERLLRLHGHPAVWWIGQFIKYATRPQPVLQSIIDEKISQLQFETPIVGVHVRRTDKVGTEAALHEIDEYMVHVEEYYQRLKRIEEVPIKRVFLATDEPRLLAEAQSKFPDYTFISDNAISKTAGLGQRYSEESLKGVIIDIQLLSETDYLVCTFSSQVCRVAYEIMQTRFPDASAYFHSLDDIYYFGGQMAHDEVALYQHVPRNPQEMPLEPGDTVGIAGNHWDGYSKGHNRRVNKGGLYPSYKTEDKTIIAKMPAYPEAENVEL